MVGVRAKRRLNFTVIQSRLKLVIWPSWPNGMVCTWPFWWRSLIERRVKPSTVPLALPPVDVLADAERIVGQVEDARDDVLYQRLAAERDRDAEHRGAGDQRRDVHAERFERDHHGDDGDHDRPVPRRSGIMVLMREAGGAVASPSVIASAALLFLRAM